MKINREIFYRCPLSQGKLNLENEVVINGKIDSGLLCLDGNPKYKISDGIPDFRILNELPAIVKETLSYYEKEAEIYDKYLPLTFDTFGVDECKVRSEMIDLLSIKPEHRVLRQVVAPAGILK